MKKLTTPFRNMIVVALVAFFCLAACSSIILITQLHWDGPFTDMWEVMLFMQPGYEGEVSWSGLWEHYGNSHRFAFAKLLWLSDWWLVNGNNHFLLALSVTCQLIIALIFLIAIKPMHFKKRWLCLYASLVFFYVFNPSQLFNFFHTFDVQWFIVTVVAVLSTYFLSANGIHAWVKLCLVFALCLLASLCNFSGMLIFLSSIFLMWWWCYPIKLIVIFSIATCLYYMLYSIGMQIQSENLVAYAFNIEDLPRHKSIFYIAAILAIYPLTMLSSPLAFVMKAGGDWHVEVSVLNWLPQIGLLFFIVFIVVQLINRRDDVRPNVRLAGGLIFYTLLTAAAIAMGRGVFFETAYADRFQNIVLLFWLAVALLLVSWWRIKGLFIAVGFALLTHGLTVFHQLDRSMILVNRAELSHAALRLGIVDKMNALQGTVSKFQLMFNPGYSLENERAFLSAHNLGVFAVPDWDPPQVEERSSAAHCSMSFGIAENGLVQKAELTLLQLSSEGAVQPALFIYVGERWVGLLPPKRSDYFLSWLITPNENLIYEGFMNGQFHRPLNLSVFVKESGRWCAASVVAD